MELALKWVLIDFIIILVMVLVQRDFIMLIAVMDSILSLEGLNGGLGIQELF